MLVETQIYVAWNVWCNKRFLSMFMIYECKVCACKLICCIVEENKFLTAAGENKSLTVEDSTVRVMPYTSWGICLGNPENFDDFYWGLINGSLCSVGEYQKSIVTGLDFRLQNNLLGNLEKLDGFHRGLIVWSFSSVGDLNDVLWGFLME